MNSASAQLYRFLAGAAWRFHENLLEQNVGRHESGHSVIFLGTVSRPDGEYVRFWSSNIPTGYGEKEVPRTKIAYAIFSRLETPANLSRIHDVPETDSYLASLLRKKSNFAEAARMCGI